MARSSGSYTDRYFPWSGDIAQTSLAHSTYSYPAEATTKFVSVSPRTSPTSNKESLRALRMVNACFKIDGQVPSNQLLVVSRKKAGSYSTHPAVGSKLK